MQQVNKRATAIKAVLFLMVLMALPTMYVLAGGGPSGPGDSPTGTPIDGGISLLVAAGIGYGAKKVRDARKKTKQADENNAL